MHCHFAQSVYSHSQLIKPMLPNIPNNITFTFLAAVAYAYVLFVRASKKNTVFRFGTLFWLMLTGIAALLGFFMVTDTLPPRTPLLIAPTFVMMIVAFSTTRGRAFIDALDAKSLVWLSLVRIPVEICLYWLFLAGQVPEIMTFNGLNWDIIAGVTAPLVVYFYFIKKRMTKSLFLAWNVMGLVLLTSIIVIATLSVPSPFQQFGFEQPNIGILQFPIVWLPSFVAPLVYFSHFVLIRRVMRREVNVDSKSK